jgi:hypothetical protein
LAGEFTNRLIEQTFYAVQACGSFPVRRHPTTHLICPSTTAWLTLALSAEYWPLRTRAAMPASLADRSVDALAFARFMSWLAPDKLTLSPFPALAAAARESLPPPTAPAPPAPAALPGARVSILVFVIFIFFFRSYGVTAVGTTRPVGKPKEQP